MDVQSAGPVAFSSSDQICDSGWHVPVLLEARTVHLWGFSLEGTSATIALCREWLSQDERVRAGRCVRLEDGNRYILARGCLRAVLARYTGFEPSELAFHSGAAGKPALAGLPAGVAPIHFNVSHSHGRLLIAVARQQEVGVDLERMRADVEVVKLAQRFYSPAECESVMGLPGAAQAGQFFRYWTAKEAYLKCKGIGLQFPLDRCEVTLLPDGLAAAVNWNPVSGSVEQGLVRFLALEDGWIGAVTAQGDEWRTEACCWP